MSKYKLYYQNKEYNENDNILFVNFYTNEHLNILQNYSNKTILYDSKEIFLNNLEKIKEIIKKKIDVISFDCDIQMIINKIKNKKKEIIGVLSNNKNLQFITELEKVYEIDYSADSQYFIKKDTPNLCIINIQNTLDNNKLLEKRIAKNTHKTYIIHSSCNDILYRLFINNYWDQNIDFIKIYKNCYFSNNIPSFLKSSICKKYGLIEKMNDPLIYFGDCNDDDYEKILNYENLIFIIWMSVEPGNKKLKNKTKILRKKNNLYHFAANKFLLRNLENYNINSRIFPIHSMVDPTIFKPVQKKGDKILICQSQKIQYELIKELPEYEFLFCNKFDLNDQIIAAELYRKCFIVVRLTEYDGYLPMVDQLESMNIPIVHNFSDYGLKWDNINDVKNHILEYSPPIINYKHQYSFDLFKDKLNSNHLDMIYNNLNEIRGLICKYKNILFVSNNNEDATIIEFIKKKKKNREIDINFIFLFGNNQNKKFNELRKKNYTPDLIILKGNCEIDIYKYYKAPTIFLVDDLFLDNLSVPYWDNRCYKYINNSIIDKINKYDISFVSSQHINDILKKYNLNCKLFYWEFIPYYGKSIIKNNNRKYNYGVIKGSIFPNDINPGKNNNIIIEEYTILQKYLHDVKYIVYDSNYDISCQIKVDAFMNGCIYNIPKYIILRKQNRLQFKKGEEYIIKFEGCVITEKLGDGLFFIEGVNDKEFIIYYNSENDLEIDELEFIKMQKINDEIAGYNPVCLKGIDVEYLYYIYGQIDNGKILDKLGLFNIFTYYSNGLLYKKYNVELLKRKWCYDLGKNEHILDLSEFSNFVLKYSNNIISKKCLVISKKINGHGGNQKTALQIIQLLEKYFIVEVFSNNMNQKEYHFIGDSLDCRIHNMKIIKKKKDDDFILHINQNSYEFIINNKFNDYFKIFDKIIHPKLYVISHNSSDPFNELIIQNQNYITKVLTINKFHQDVLIYHGLKIPHGIFYNYVEREYYEEKREKFRKKIGFIGRFTKEKNLDLLIAAMKSLNWLELVIIGGNNETGEKNNNIIWKGVLEKDEIISELRGCDYLVVPSSTEGLPFVILEAMNIGIPCIYSRIIGSDELIGEEGERGFTFELIGYEDCKMKMDWSVFEKVDEHFEENIKNILKCVRDAYNISIKDWNDMSKKCKNFVRNNYLENQTNKKNMKSLEIFL